MGLHATSLGVLCVYFLFFGLMSGDKVNKLFRLAGILASTLIIALSFSRMTYLTTMILFRFFYRSLPVGEWRVAIVAGLLVVSLFLAQIIQRTKWGYSKESVDGGQTLDAGRIIRSCLSYLRRQRRVRPEMCNRKLKMSPQC